jgi:hypothetical protein
MNFRAAPDSGTVCAVRKIIAGPIDFDPAILQGRPAGIRRHLHHAIKSDPD